MDELLEQLAAELDERLWARFGNRIERALAGDRGLTWEQAAEKLGLSKSEFYRLRNEKRIPQPNAFTKRWSSRELDAFLAGKWRPRADY